MICKKSTSIEKLRDIDELLQMQCDDSEEFAVCTDTTSFADCL